MSKDRIAIIGAGIHGVSAGYHLARAGVKARIFDSGAPASGPTGRSSAICRAYYRNPFLASMARRSIDFIANLSATHPGLETGFRRTGALFLHGREDVRLAEASVERLNAMGTSVDALNPTELTQRFPEMDFHDVSFGAWERDAGYADPALTTLSLFEAAIGNGAISCLYTKIARIELLAGDRVKLVSTDGVVSEHDRVLIAAGPWTGRLAETVGVRLPLTAERHFIATFDWGGARPIEYSIDDVPLDYYSKAEGTDLFIVGGLNEQPSVDPDAYVETIRDEEVSRLGSSIISRIPALEHAHFRGGWASLYDVSADWQPVLGEIAPNVFVDAGTSGHGFKLAPALGELMADLLLDRQTPAELAHFHPRRFAAGPGLQAGYGSARILG